MSKKNRAADRTERAAAIQAQAASKERNRRILIVVAVLVVLSAVIAAGVIFSGGDRTAPTAGKGAPAAAASGQALVVGDEPDAPTKVVVYEDFLCPYCREFEVASRDFLRVAAKEGRVQVEYRPFHLLPDEYSTLALTAWSAVLEGGTGAQALRLHDLLFENQPYEADKDKPGIDDLVDLAREAGVKDDAVLDAMREPNADFVTAAGDAATAAGVEGTPTVLVNGKELQGSSVTDMADELERLIAQG